MTPEDIEAVILACVPGGDICDPQRVADNLRAHLSSTPSETGLDAGELMKEIERLKHERNMAGLTAARHYLPRIAELEEALRFYATLQVDGGERARKALGQPTS